MDDNPRCIICDEVCNKDFKKLTDKTRATIEKASKERGDNVHRKLRTNGTFIVHNNCYVNFTHYKHVEAARSRSTTPQSSSTSSISTRSTPAFTFDTKCFLCKEDASDAFCSAQNRKYVSRRIIVRIVNQESTLLSILKHAEELKTPIANDVAFTLLHVDLDSNKPRYHDKCLKDFYRKVAEPKPRIIITEPVLQHINNYLQEHSEECQFSIAEILSTYDGEVPETRYLYKKIEEAFGDDIMLCKNRGKDPILCYKNMGTTLLSEAWYGNRCEDTQEERLRIVKLAAQIICEDVRSEVYECETYPIPHKFLDNAEEDIPKSLKVLIDSMILKHKKNDLSKWHVKCTAISHIIINAIRPRSFLSPVLLALSSLIHAKTGSKDLITLLNNLGLCGSYKENMLFELSSVLYEDKPDFSQCFSQFVFDNADHNVHTLDGFKTFHSMGGIHCVTPAGLVTSNEKLPRLKKFFQQNPSVSLVK